MLDYAQLAALVAIHRRGSFDLAAAALSVTPSAISQRLKALEERMGTLLIQRGQPCRATDAALPLIRHFDDVMLLQSTLDTTPSPTTLRIAVTADSLATWVLPALAETTGFLFDLVIDDQDHSQTLLRRGDVSAAITGHPGPLQGCDTFPLGALRYHATASPEFVARWFQTGVSPATLARAPALTFSDKDRLQRDWISAHHAVRAGFAFPTHRIASSTGFVEACLLGLGWGLNPAALVAPHLASGRLVELVTNTPLDVPLYWQLARLTAPALVPVTKAITRTAARHLIGHLTPPAT
jgi:LysR family transcriptional regulator (chromosome initiation inhibitor)